MQAGWRKLHEANKRHQESTTVSGAYLLKSIITGPDPEEASDTRRAQQMDVDPDVRDST